jgi:hypothetical protein
VILPTVIWISFAYVAHSNDKFASKLRGARSAKTKQELIEGDQSWVVLAVVAFFIVFACVEVWIRIQGWDARHMLLNPGNWERDVFHGIFLGLGLVGISILFRRHFPEARKFTLIVMAGIPSPAVVRASLVLIVVFTEELWRAVCLRALLAEGFSGQQALVATSIVYGLTYLVWGDLVAISEGFVGAACGGLFLWSGSFLVPFAAHTILLAQVLLYAVAAAPGTGPGDIHRRPFTKCPACGTTLILRQVNLNPNEAFFCPSCHTRITISDSRRKFFRWGFVFVSTGLLVASWDIFPDAVRGSGLDFLLSLAVTFCAGIGLGSILQVLFPPKLECGDPDLIALNLGDHEAVHPDAERTNGLNEPDSKDEEGDMPQ